MKFKSFLGVILPLALSSTALADAVVLKNGTLIDAETVTENEDGSALLDFGFQQITIPAAEVSRVIKIEDRLYTFGSDKEYKEVKDASSAVSEACVLVRQPGGLGSGFVIHPDGYLITNAHVIDGSTRIEITVFKKGDEGLEREVFKKVKILSVSRREDLALLKIEPEEEDRKFVFVPVGESRGLEAGDAVFAVGNPYGLERTVSEGVISVASRADESGLSLQHTAPINSGNSGGPLFNMRGEVVGVNARKAGGGDGVGFAISGSVLRMFLDHRDAYAFDPSSQNGGYIYPAPPGAPDADKDAEVTSGS